MSVHYALEDFNKFSTDSYDHQVHQNQFKIPPYLVHNNDGESIRQEFCNMSEEGKIVWDTFIEIKENAKKTAEQDISSILEKVSLDILLFILVTFLKIGLNQVV